MPQNDGGVRRHRTRATFHATAMVRDYDVAVDRLGSLIGMRVLEYSEQHDPAIGRRGGMTWIGDGSLELCEPIVDGAYPDRFVRRTGGGMQGIAVWVDNFASSVEHLARLGVAMPVQMESGFGFSSPSGTVGLQFEWAEFTVDEDPRAGAPEPAYTVEPLLDVTQMAFIGAVVDDPIADGRHLAAVLDTAVTFERPDAASGEPVAAASVGDCMLALYRLGTERSAALWGRSHDRPRISLLGVRVPELGIARDALDRAGVTIIREGDGWLVLDPAATADIELAVVDRLLPGDPRDREK